VVALGALDATGTLAMELPLPPLGGLDHQHVLGQAGYINPSGAVVLGSPSDVLLVSSSY
jgi:hypothetical protein